MDTFSGNTSNRFARFVLFGNYFLALCIVALSFETTLKNDFSITDASYYVLVFLSVVVYYTYAYISGVNVADDANPRSTWYHQNQRLVYATQTLYSVLIACLTCLIVVRYFPSFQLLSFSNWFLLLIFPATALLYYGIIFPASFRIRLRTVAWLKPFLIGFVCTGAIVIYPMIFHSLQQQSAFYLSLANGCYFLTNWFFATAIAIMFDIKDFAADHNYHLKTFVVSKGLRYTIFSILLPLSVASFFSFIVFALLKNFSLLQVSINVIPFLLLLYVSTSFRRRRGILYYLVIIDGLLLVKAFFGVITMTVLK